MWPDTVPDLTPEEAVAAASKLWRFALGESCPYDIYVTSGRRHTWQHMDKLRVNPEKGWRQFIYDLSWLFFTKANPGTRRTSMDVRKLEDKLVKEVLDRGWLDGKLKKAKADPLLDALRLERKKYDSLVAREKQWKAKLKRAQNALKKVQRELRKYEKEGA